MRSVLPVNDRSEGRFMRIINFGSMNLDYVYKVEHFVQPGETLAAKKMNVFPGGKGLNQSVAAGRAGGEIFHAGLIGENGGLLMDCLKQTPVNLDYIKKIETSQGHAVIQVNPEGENCILIHGGSNLCLTKAYIDGTLEHFERGDYVMLQNEINNTSYIIEAAFKKGMKVVLNPSPIDQDILHTDFCKVDWLIVNAVEARELGSTMDVFEAITRLEEKYPHMGILLTLGDKGCLCRREKVSCKCPAFCVKAVDTTAAGDTFAGYFVAGLSKGLELPENILLASAAAAIAVSREGASPSIPAIAEVKEFLKRKDHAGGEPAVSLILRKGGF